MKRLRVLALMHEHLVPPESIAGMDAADVNNIRMEYDVRTALQGLGHDVHVLGVADELAPIRGALNEIKPHVCFNLLTHFLDVGAYHAHVVSYLELLKAPYTGCNPRGLLLAGDKALSKKVLSYHRIRVPKFAVYRHGKAVRMAGKLSFPLFVKSVSEEASAGISQASIVRDLDGLRERVEFVHRNVGTDAIAEEYVEGRELTVGVVGNERLTALPTQELMFDSLPEGTAPIMTSRAKWDLAYQKKIGVRTESAKNLPDGVAAQIQRTAKRLYRALGLSGYARVDLRLSEEGHVFVIEANPNPDLCEVEDFAVSAAEAGLPYRKLIQRLVSLGQQYRPAWKVK